MPTKSLNLRYSRITICRNLYDYARFVDRSEIDEGVCPLPLLLRSEEDRGVRQILARMSIETQWFQPSGKGGEKLPTLENHPYQHPRRHVLLENGLSPTGIYIRCLEKLHGSSSHLDEKNIVISLKDEFGIIAASYAAFNRRPFEMVSSLNEVFEFINPDRFDSLAIFGKPENFSEKALSRFHESLCVRGTVVPFHPQRTGYGYLTGRDAVALSWLSVKNMLYDYATTKNSSVLISANNCGYLAGKEIFFTHFADGADPKSFDVKRLVKEFWLVVSSCSHSDLHCASIGNAILCSKNDTTSTDTHPEAADIPACHKAECHIEKAKPSIRRINIRSLMARMIFLNSCGSFSIHSSRVAMRATLSSNAVEGFPSHFIASQTIRAGNPDENVLFMLLLKSGLPVGRALSFFNNFITRQKGGRTNFILIGDPAISYFPFGISEQKPARLISNPAGQLTFRKRLESGMYSLLRIRTKQPRPFAGSVRPLYVINKSYDSSMPALTSWAFEDPSTREIHVALYAKRRVHKTLKFEINGNENKDLFLRQRALALLQNLQYFEHYNVKMDSYKNDMEQIFCLSTALKRATFIENCYCNKHAIMSHIELCIDQALEKLQQSICKDILQWAQMRNSLQVTRAPYFHFNNVSGFNKKCYICGNRLGALKKTRYDGLGASRALIICPRCGLLENTSRGFPLLRIQFCETQHLPMVKGRITTGKFSKTTKGFLGVTILNCNRKIKVYCRDFHVLKSKSLDQDVELLFQEDTPAPGPYQLMALLISELEINYAFRPLSLALNK